LSLEAVNTSSSLLSQCNGDFGLSNFRNGAIFVNYTKGVRDLVNKPKPGANAGEILWVQGSQQWLSLGLATAVPKKM